MIIYRCHVVVTDAKNKKITLTCGERRIALSQMSDQNILIARGFAGDALEVAIKIDDDKCAWLFGEKTAAWGWLDEVTS